MSVVSSIQPTEPLIDLRTGRMSFAWTKWFQSIASTVNQGFDPQGNYQGPIGASATIVGREFLATIVQFLTDAGVIEAAGLPAATSTAQGAVVMPAGAGSNVLGSAAIHPSSAFDPSGAAAAAQTAAEAHADTVAATAQSNAESFASNASNLASGTVAVARLPGLTVTITTAALTVGGTQGSQTFTNGILTAEVAAT